MSTVFFLYGVNGDSGIALFEKGKYGRALKALKAEVAAQPENDGVNHFLGRSYLALNQPGEALPYLKKAAALDPQKADYHFWLGIDYWALLEFEKELQSYHTALAIDPEHVPSMVYSGHNQMDRGNWEKAIAFYQSALERLPDNAEALFYMGRALRELGRTRKENTIWKTFLSYYRTGPRALSAVKSLNANGDFTYRAFRLGSRWAVVKQIQFAADRADLEAESADAIRTIGREMDQHRDLVLQVIVYVTRDKPLAEKRAKNIKRALINTQPSLSVDRIKISWFDVPERLHLNGKKHELSPSVRFFTTPHGE